MDGRTLSKRAFASLTVAAILAGCAAGGAVAPSPTAARASAPATAAPASTAAAASASAVAPTSPAASPVPSAAATIREVAGTMSCLTWSFGSSGNNQVSQFRDGTFTCSDVANDPRVVGSETALWNATQWESVGKGLSFWVPDEKGAFVQWGTRHLENAGGAWEGNGTGVYSADRGNIIVTWYKGTGGYAGLGYFELLTGPRANMTIRGQIFHGDPPVLTGFPPVTGAAPSPNAEGTPLPIPAATPTAIAYGPVAVTQGTTDYTTVDIGTGVYAGIDRINDPRVSGTYLAPGWKLNFSGATADSLGYGTQWGPTRLRNAGGEWQGLASGIYDSNSDAIAIWYTGTGGYAGLSYFELIGKPNLFDPAIPVDRYGVFGMIYPASPPAP